MSVKNKHFLRVAFLFLLGLSANPGFAQDEEARATGAAAPRSPWVWMGKIGNGEWGSNRYINTASIHREGAYVKYMLALESAFDKRGPEVREVTLDCVAKTRVENSSYEPFRAEDMKSFFPGTIVGTESTFACREADREARGQ